MRLKVLTIGLTVVLEICVNVAFGLPLFGVWLGKWIANRLGLSSTFDTFWAVARWPISIMSIMLVLAHVYWTGPNVRQPFRWVSPGSIIATFLWLLAVAGFGLYLTFANPGSAYGVVGSLIVLLVFLNFSGLVLFVGAELNAILYKVAQDSALHSPHLGNDPIPALPDG